MKINYAEGDLIVAARDSLSEPNKIKKGQVFVCSGFVESLKTDYNQLGLGVVLKGVSPKLPSKSWVCDLFTKFTPKPDKFFIGEPQEITLEQEDA